ncbi:MAG TPA: ZIP family metal transporter, partial [Pseudomonadaceae bacterium]|nr:ZIP family metal transporter [Pseudomonadaceae bacterium]
MLSWIILFSLLGSIGAIALSASLLWLPPRVRTALVPVLVSYAAGTLLGAAFLGMLPTALQQAPADKMLIVVLLGLVLFFLLEKLVLWRHCHDVDCSVHARPGPLLLIGDAFHNFVDGVVIAAAFLSSVPLGITAALAVIAHEIPQEVGDFAILLDSGYERRRALWLNTLSSIATVPGALIAYYW